MGEDEAERRVVTRRREEGEGETSGGWRGRVALPGRGSFSVPYAWRRRRTAEATAIRVARSPLASAALPPWTNRSATCVNTPTSIVFSYYSCISIF